MKNQSETIRKFVTYINNENHLGGFWLPNIQRPFVWKEEQIEKVYDSILREYPIGSMLIWKTKSTIKHRKFIDNWKDSLKLTDFYVPLSENAKMLVLDGQQRIQSLFIGLNGSYNGRELYFDILSGDLKDPEDTRFDFKFLDNSARYPWIKFKDIVFSDKSNKEIRKWVAIQAETPINDTDSDRIDENVEQVRNVFCTQENILYQIIDSIDKPETYSESDVVEIFIRANSGGTFLNKSDLMFSLLVSSWDDIEDNMSDLLQSINATGYNFTRDFVLKTFLVLLDKGARYNVKKLREDGTKDLIKSEWNNIANSIKKVKDFIYDKTFLKTDKTIPSYLSLIPLIYFHYKFKNTWDIHLSDYQTYLLRSSFTGVFSGTPDNVIDKLVKRINIDKDFDINQLFGVIREDNRVLDVTENSILDLKYYHKEIHLFFNIWYGFNYQPTLKDSKPQIDHIFPQAELKKIKYVNPDTGALNLMKYGYEERDQIGNLMLLTAKENGPSGKTDILPEVFFADKDDDYLDLHLIPKNRDFWKIENFEHFIEARKALILKKFSYLIQKKKDTQ